MKILIIEHFDDRSSERLGRQQFWERVSNQFRGRVELSICEQEKNQDGFLVEASGQPFELDGFDLILIHSRDMHYNETETYVGLARQKAKAFVCYSGGTETVSAPNIEGRQINLMPLDQLRTKVNAFLEKLVRDGAVNTEAFYLLADIDPRIQAALKLLYLFLPLDVQLQLHDDTLYQEKCKEEASKLETHLEEIVHLAGQIADGEISADQIQTLGGVVPTISPGDEINLLRNLFAHTARITRGGDKNELLSLFGYDLADPNTQGQLAPPLAEAGFHRTYENLRDRLLALAVTDDRYGG